MSLEDQTLVNRAHSLTISETAGRSTGPSTIPVLNQDDGPSRLKEQLSEETMKLLNIKPAQKRKWDPIDYP